jgi:excisionase family DNA binding protein
MPDQQYLTVTEIAERYRCSIWSIYSYVKHGGLPHIRRGGRLLFDPREVDNHFRGRRSPTPDTEAAAAG